MSEPLSPPPQQQQNTSSSIPPLLTSPPYSTPYHRQLHHHLPSPNLREYRKGNWTLEETFILITAKRLDDERRINATVTTANSSRATGELRWKWVENYCWNNGCLRSQNQCNDKWDNLLRDYKKIREFEVSLSSSNNPSYWEMDKNQRKNRNMPSNFILRIYEALNEVVQRKYHPSQTTLSIQTPLVNTFSPPSMPPPPPSTAAPVALGNSGASPSSERDGISGRGEVDQSPKLDQEKKRRKMRDIESSIVGSTSVLAQTLMNYEEKREKQHGERMEVEHQRLRIEESRNEMNMQEISSLITSVNNLSTAIHALISDRRGK